MRLPGTRYQEHGWEQVRKLLGQCSLQAVRQGDPTRLADPALAALTLDWYTDTVAAALHRSARGARAEAPGNSYGESVAELALGLVFELQAHPEHWCALVTALAGEQARADDFWRAPNGDATLRKKFNDMYAGLRDKVDADNYQVAVGRACSPNKIYTYRMLDTAHREIAALFAGWREHADQVAAILGRAPGRDGAAMPIEARQMKGVADCRPEWVIRWSETLERFGGAPGPLHTRSKRFSSLKNSPDKIGAMLAEIGDYEQLSANLDSADPWRDDAGEATLWLDDYWRVLSESDACQSSEPDRILAAQVQPDDDDGDGEPAAPDRDPSPEVEPEVAPEVEPKTALAWEQAAVAVCLPLRFVMSARAAQDGGSWAARVLQAESVPIRLAVYQKLLGAEDDSYPDEWRDPATGALPTLQQLAALDGVSIPTLRKRRNEAMAKLHAANRGPGP